MDKKFSDILNEVFDRRVQGNPLYSLRSFARDLSLAPSTLSEILNKKRGISARRAAAIAKRLDFPDWQQELFVDLATRDHAKSPRLRELALARLKYTALKNRRNVLNNLAMSALTSWLDLAILESTYLKDFQPCGKWLANKLNISEDEVSRSIRRLKAAKLLKVNSEGRWIDVSPCFTTSDGVPSEFIKSFHCSTLRLAEEKIRGRGLENRVVKGVVFSILDQDVPRARAILDAAISQIVELGERSGQPTDHILCFSTQLLFLSQTGGQK